MTGLTGLNFGLDHAKNCRCSTSLQGDCAQMKLSRLFKLTLFVSVSALVVAAPATTGMTMGKVDIKSAGPLAFGPDGVLFIGDSLGAKVVALDTGDTKAGGPSSINMTAIDSKIAAALGTAADQISIRDIATNPVSKNVYISVNRGRGADAKAVLVKLDTAGKLSEVDLDNVKYSAASLPNPPTQNNQKTNTITEVRYVDGKVLVAGLSNEEFSSNMKVIPFPFADADRGALIEMYHGSHARYETNSPIRTFVPYTIDNKQYILAAYTCTPLVKIPVSELKSGAKIQGTTIAEMGAGNQPLDMVAYKKNGHEYILMANSSHGVTKLDMANVGSYKAITNPVADVAGVPYTTISELRNVKHLQAYDDRQALILSGTSGAMDLRTIALP